MIRYCKVLLIIFISFLLTNIIISINAQGCKDIIVVDDATDGDYNLLLKVRDPSRPGLQVLCIVPLGYEYTYNHPWTGKPMEFKTKHKFIGVTTNKDTLPNIVKAGMTLTDMGLAFGDADTGSNWKNPTRNAWDDFDWMRYAYEKADDEDQAVTLLTKDCVDKLHATGVSENLFVVGPKKGFVIEADAFRYIIKEIDDFIVMSNYPKELWKTQRYKKFPIASSFDTEKEKYVKKLRTIRLNSLYGVKIMEIGEDWIVARQLIPFLRFYTNKISFMGNSVKIHLGERKTVGDYSVRLLDIDGKKAKVSISYVFKAWEDKMSHFIESKYGDITIEDMINWSRLHGDDLEGLRPMCEDFFQYESAMIYKIPEENFEIMSSSWFSANHACSSIYVPIHIANTDIYEAYKTEKAAELSLELLDIYQHDTLTPYFKKVEEVFLNETEEHEKITTKLIENDFNVTELLTILDTSIQEQAWLTEQIWLELGKNYNSDPEIIEIIGDIWEKNYTVSLDLMELAVDKLKNISELKILNKIIDLTLNVCKSRIDVVNVFEKNISNIYEGYENGKNLIEQGKYKSGFQLIKNVFHISDMMLKDRAPSDYDNMIENKERVIVSELNFFVLIVFFAVTFLIIFIKKNR